MGGPLTDDEAALLYTVQMRGADAYPIYEFKPGCWYIDSWRSWKGLPTTFKTKREAVARFEGWMSLALERWREMRREHPDAILTAVGVRYQ